MSPSVRFWNSDRVKSPGEFLSVETFTPLPWPVFPWQETQFLVNIANPVLLLASPLTTGFFNALKLAGTVQAFVCADA